MSWLRALKGTARSGLAVERKRLEPVGAARGALGLALVVGVSLALFGPAVAVSSAFGAFQAAIATFQRSWRPRPTLALASGASLAVSTFIGYLTAAHDGLFLALLLLWTFLSGLAWAAGPTAGLIASSNVAMMLVTVTLPTSVATAAGHAAVIFAGGLVQAALVALVPVRRWGAQRDALADALAAEADYARRLRHDPVAPFDPVPLMTARNAAAVTPRQARRRPPELHGSRGLAERIRPVLASLADPAGGVPGEGPQRARVRELLDAAAAVLDAAAHAVRHGEPVALPAPALDALRTPDTGSVLTGPPRRAATRLAALLGDVLETAEPHGETPIRTGVSRSRPTLLRLAPIVLAQVRAELRHESPVLRHAIRVSVVTAAGYLLGTVLPFGHGYWAPMASVMVMRPDFSQTYARSVARFGGTLVGVGLATAVVRSAHPGTYLSAGLAVLCAFGMYLLMRTGYAASQVCVSAYVVFLLGTAGEGVDQTVRERVLLTLLGGLLAMLAYAVYPAWETPRLRGRLADWLEAIGRYASVVAAGYADPAGPADPEVREALLRTRAARVAWQEALERAAHEPVRHRGLSHAAVEQAEHALGEFGRVAMLMEAHLPDRGAAPLPYAAALAEALRRSTERGAKELRERGEPDWAELRETADAWSGAPPDHFLLHKGAVLLLESLDELATALSETTPSRR
ncbi:fusaric acid resistance protein [Streptomyces cinereoruber]|uniref:FUSC family protein n=1 Tax=Streptomyces cinereoruber TaxID=67260 RepID=A0AAV4KQG7_9ACTN|nr:FUSC family protein [Streptomyces cinereoruber]MBB4161516.1 putative membrane protein YccC [Streptomyces cinereoruber]MBY8818587.1 FUSC family protein [Streptomyces cinereoruber]NIH60812.1 putative membrane protein YccC [Streptomyces cinereoruber]QEV33450.1 FUSC family protein [Streptomyces cinereoruber]GGR44550.1 fusaric acid resistance protein [Streptomyces cinereoruber]